MRFGTFNPTEYLAKSKNFIINARDTPEIVSLLTPFNYDADKLNEGLELHSDAETTQLAQETEYGDQYRATQNLHNAREEFHRIYIRHIKTARIALKDMLQYWRELMLIGRRFEKFTDYTKQAKSFYANSLTTPDAMTEMNRLGLTAEMFNGMLTQLENLEALKRAQETETGEAQRATMARDAAFEEFSEWMSDLLAITKIALEDHPQLIEILGVVDPS